MALDVPRIRALLFDVDGTLSDTDDRYVARLASWLRALRLVSADVHALSLARRLVMRLESPANLLYSLPDRLGIDDRIAVIGEWLHRRGLVTANHRFTIIPGVHHALSILAQNYPLAVVTARGHRATLAFLHQFNLAGHFQCVASALTSARTKPHPAPIIWAANQLALPPQACLMIGDTTVDIKAGKAAGSQTVGVLSGFGEEHELLRAGADLVLPSVVDLPEILPISRQN